LNAQCGLLVNSSRQIIYADSTERFAEAAGREAKKIQEEMDVYLRDKNILPNSIVSNCP
jgi:orotidine-5'-phosphate decarboxylase